MENKIFYVVLFLALLSSCTSKVHLVKGKFFEGLSLSDERFFRHKSKEQSNSLKKITQSDGYGYYAWKTVAYNYEMRNDSILLSGVKKQANPTNVSIYKTILNEELISSKIDEQGYFEEKGKVLTNNLYFIDDHRCIYVSFDDDRFSQDEGSILPLFFDSKNYPIKKKDKKLLEQYLRGYYTLIKDTIFIHFHQPFSNAEYFINGLINNNTITFTSMTVPNSPKNIYEGGYNAVKVEFKEIFNVINHPIFEWIQPVKDIFYPKQTYLSTGFERYKGKTKNKLHEKILYKYPDLKFTKDIIIIGIEYLHNEDNSNPCQRIRKYTLKDLYNSKKFEIIEYIGHTEMNECDIETW